MTVRFSKFCFFLLAFFAPKIDAQPQKLRVIHINDIQSRFENAGKLASLIQAIKDQNVEGGQTLVLDAGDFHMGSLLQHVMKSEGGEWALLGAMGVEYTSLGNHEFDFGVDQLVTARKASRKWGFPEVKVIQTNLFAKSSPFKPEGLIDHRSLIIEKGNIKIGLLGMMGKGAFAVTPPLFKDYQICEEKKCVEEEAKALKAKGADIVILISHSGIYPDFYAGNYRYTGEDWEFAQKTQHVDLIVSGHSHVILPKPVVAKTGCVIVQAGSDGVGVGYVDLEIAEQETQVAGGEVLYLREMDTLKDQPSVQTLYQKIWKSVVALTQQRLNVVPSDVVADIPNTMMNRPRITELGHFFSRLAFLELRDQGFEHIQDLVLPQGFLRQPLQRGPRTVEELYQSFPLGGDDKEPTLGYPLLSVYLDRSGYRDLLEMSSTIGILFHPGYYLYFSNYKIMSHIMRPPFDNIASQMPKPNEKGLYHVVIDKYMYEMLGKVGEASFGLLHLQPLDANGEPTSKLSYLRDQDGQALSVFELVTKYLVKNSGKYDVADVKSLRQTPVDGFGAEFFRSWTWRMWSILALLTVFFGFFLFFSRRILKLLQKTRI